jgi:hypothetical protein
MIIPAKTKKTGRDERCTTNAVAALLIYALRVISLSNKLNCGVEVALYWKKPVTAEI